MMKLEVSESKKNRKLEIVPINDHAIRFRIMNENKVETHIIIRNDELAKLKKFWSELNESGTDKE